MSAQQQPIPWIAVVLILVASVLIATLILKIAAMRRR